ncbi:hypothetical protein Unana1_00287 [Umbelopsis nana]
MTSYTDEQLNAELEKLQQNITLTLQAIDQNFAKCHQTIATRIIPQVEKYADASQGVWNGSKSLDSSRTSLQVSDDMEGSNRPPLGTKESVNGSPSAAQWSEHDDLQSPWERLRREMNLEAMSDTTSAGHTTPQKRNINTPSQSVQSNRLLGKVLNKHFKSSSNALPRAEASSVGSSVPKPTLLMSDTTSSKRTPDVNLSRVEHMSADDGEDDSNNQNPYSPPRTIQFAVPRSQLIKTPAKEAAKIIVDDIMLTSGASPPAKAWKAHDRKEDDHRPPSVSFTRESSSSVADSYDQHSQHSTIDSWAARDETHIEQPQDNVMMEGLGETVQQGLDPAEQFETMLGRRKGTATPMTGRISSPCPPGLWLDGNQSRSPGRSRFQLPGSPNLQRVYDGSQDLSKKSGAHKFVKTSHSDVFDDDNDMLRKTGKLVDEDTLENYTQGIDSDFPFRAGSSEANDTAGFVSHITSHTVMEASSLAGSDLGVGYELSGVLPTKPSQASPGPSEASMTMTSGFTGQIPARFSLEYFPSVFQSPPGSTQLTRVYTAFAEANGRVLDVDAILKDINDPTDSYNHTNVELLVDLLVRKRFIKRDRNGWRLRV